MLNELRARTAQCLSSCLRHRSFNSDVSENSVRRNDALLDIVRRDPVESVWFLKVVMFFGGVSGLLVSAACGAFLTLFWEPAGLCNRPLRLWILVHSLLQVMQVPVRIVFLARLILTEASNGNVYRCVESVTGSTAWHVSKQVSTATYAWFVLGIVWLLNSDYCPECPGLFRLTVAVIVSAAARLLITLACFYRSFHPSRFGQPEAQKPKGAEKHVINRTTSVLEYSPDLFEDPTGASCAVCLCEFEYGDSLRQLPCKHFFHEKCVDRWLERNKKCPLCMGDIEVCTQCCSDSKKSS